MMTGIPVNRIAQTESNKLAIPELIESKVIGQKKLF
jgi:ATP-dependent Clp protease ATP-binding subunit ClpC